MSIKFSTWGWPVIIIFLFLPLENLLADNMGPNEELPEVSKKAKRKRTRKRAKTKKLRPIERIEALEKEIIDIHYRLTPELRIKDSFFLEAGVTALKGTDNLEATGIGYGASLGAGYNLDSTHQLSAYLGVDTFTFLSTVYHYRIWLGKSVAVGPVLGAKFKVADFKLRNLYEGLSETPATLWGIGAIQLDIPLIYNMIAWQIGATAASDIIFFTTFGYQIEM